ncbi:DUF881 domain-containing protein [Bifidobacterium tibiigranuli]|jgi:uncharacterized protein YlxW (UPF0749 family)|uniref:DUF881 domain-containing protein n=1 Tax=Bifidobacterium tibiigranuli TaxID=2172043 RepID=UPI002353AE62|nr:DUF881 domain-containing protein [Bifidobacterium tibiigranuli]MCH3974480.1 DUF881 domain-containing protein [Bifidobacterium tibiigranuli]MCH4204595.1 DUF881 domain-containing protein [Bifidobacterium tibiigranuli]MCH4275296.1 DUF881 domain-containing protein [Bifidobacterium tibiigranuli]MCI1211937.1 DUF881 domain-containing protein [Bifidobacterium tibiigranuli]MCI1221860.1 DUF881 domain-containing protein [Bifidobacterium tibiigranuli]
MTVPRSPAEPPVHVQPRSYPVSSRAAVHKRRAVFSRAVAGLETIPAAAQRPESDRRARRRKIDDDSLRLIDDLTNRPLDPMFSDAQLARRPQSRLTVWVSHAIVFLICVGVGFGGSLFVRQLHTDPRKEIRDTLIGQLNQLNRRVDTLSADNKTLRVQVDAQSKKLGSANDNPTQREDDLVNGLSAVQGEGITLTLADPIAAQSDSTSGAGPREGQIGRIRVITDADLQQFVSLLWNSGAEAVAINGHRIGPQTSIRTAGQSILIGIDQIASPYKIEAIGNRDALAYALGAKAQPALYDSFKKAGIYPQIGKSDAIMVQAADSVDLTYAKRSD